MYVCIEKIIINVGDDEKLDLSFFFLIKFWGWFISFCFNLCTAMEEGGGGGWWVELRGVFG